MRLLSVFDQHSCRSIEAPHFKSSPEKTAVGEKLVQTGHGMKATDRDFVLSIKTVVGAIFNGSSVEQTFALHCEIKPRFLDLIRSPHGHRILCIHGKLDRFCKRKVSTGRYGTVISLWNNAAARAVKDAQMGIAQEIVRQPANRKRFKFPIPIPSQFETRRQLGLLIIGKNSNDRDKRVRKFRVIPAVLV